MKKVLSLVLAFAMILGCFSFAFASDFPDVKDDEYFSEPVNVLSSLGVIGGFPDGTFGPEKEVTRAQMATMIVNALGMTVTGQADTKFTDVPKSHWASGFINYAASVGFIAGYPDGSFKPDANVTYDQALTMIVASLGYTAESLTGTWPGAFVNKARGLGILDICSTTGSATAPRQDIACFLYKALTSPIGYVDKDGAFQRNIGPYNEETKGYDPDTMMYRLGATLKDNGHPFVIKGTEDSVIDLSKDLGAYVTAYENKDKEIVAIKEYLSTFIEGDFAYDLEDQYDFDSAKLLVEDTDKKIYGDYVSFTNGDLDKPVDKDYKKDGIKLAVKISGKTVKTIYSMQIWNAAETFYASEDVQDIIKDGQKIESETNTYKFALNDNKEIDEAKYAVAGVDSIEDIKADDVVTVYLHKNNTISKLEVTDKSIEGTITKIKKGADDTKNKYTIGGTVYGINKDALADYDSLYDLMSKSTSATYYLDYAGKIFDYGTDDEINYAVILGADSSTKFSKTTYELQMFLADGTVKDFVASESAMLKACGKDNAADLTPAVLANTQGILVSYVLNTDGGVKRVAVASKYSGSDELKFSSKGVFDNKTLDGDTVAFSYNGGAKGEAKSYAVITSAGLSGAGFTSLNYMANSKNVYKAVLLEKPTNADIKYAVLVEAAGENKDGKVYTALYEGSVEDFTFKETTPAIEVNLYTSGTAIRLAQLVFDGSNLVSGASYTAAGKVVGKAATIGSASGSVSGAVYTDSSKAKYTLEDNVMIYVYTDKNGWVEGTAADMKGSDTTINAMYLFDSDQAIKADNEYDIVLVFKK